MGYRIVRKPSRAYIVRSGANYYAENDTTLQNSLGTTEQDYYATLENNIFGKIAISDVNYLVATADLEMVSDASDYNQIQNIDDVIPLRYAYGDQDGYVKGIGNELDGSYENGIFTISSGRVVVQGVEIDIDANGISTIIDTPSADAERFYKIYLEINFNRSLNLYEAQLKNVYTDNYSEKDDIEIPTSGELIDNQPAYLYMYRLYVLHYPSFTFHKADTFNPILYGVAKYINKKEITEDANNVLKIDTEIISKKKLLWSGLTYINTDSYKIVVHPMDNPSNKTIEIVLGQRVNDVWFSREKIRHTFNENNVRLDMRHVLTAPEYSSVNNTLRWVVLDGKWESSGLNMMAVLYTYNMSTNTITTSATNRCVSEIYEIIE